MDPQELARRRRAGLFGLLIGDALGVPYEFHTAEEIPALGDIEMTPPEGYPRAHAQVPPGTWSDDGAQALVLLDSILTRGELDLEDFAGRLIGWCRHGAYAVDEIVFDVGVHTNVSVRRLESGVPPTESGGTDEDSNGNGSLMRALSVALAATGDDAELFRDACAQSAVTHAHPRALACVAVYTLWARRLIDGMGVEAGWDDAVAAFQGLARPDLVEEFQTHVLDHLSDPPRGTGDVVHSLLAAHHLLTTHADYESVVKAAVALGDDTDTTACIAGGLAGIRGGEEQIPQRWRDALRGRDVLQYLVLRL